LLNPRRTTDLARRLRRRMTLPEVLLWQVLRGRRFQDRRFRRQHPYGPFVLDFYCATARLGIEVDSSWHGADARRRHDDEREAWLASKGIRLHRIPAQAILRDMDGVLEGLGEALRKSPLHRPLGGPPPPARARPGPMGEELRR
jgi:very-short-patch-repair endonuclease